VISSKLKFSEYMLNISRSNVFGKNFLIVMNSSIMANLEMAYIFHLKWESLLVKWVQMTSILAKLEMAKNFI
jgi:hypothetical protein